MLLVVVLVIALLVLSFDCHLASSLHCWFSTSSSSLLVLLLVHRVANVMLVFHIVGIVIGPSHH
jgi:hypothetical protein